MNEPKKESRTVEVTVNGKTRTVEIRRHSPDGKTWGLWWGEIPVVCRFSTGKKLHTAARYIVDEKGGKFIVRAPVIRNRRAIPCAWADETRGNSLWTERHN